MRIVVDLFTDSNGRPVGTMRLSDRCDEPFSDWLDLLRLLERCVDQQRARAPESDDGSG
jgi:hypothetical protein